MVHVTRPRTTREACRTRYYLMVVALVPLALSAPKAEAQPSCARCLNGVRFIPSSVIAEPFATT